MPCWRVPTGEPDYVGGSTTLAKCSQNILGQRLDTKVLILLPVRRVRTFEKRGKRPQWNSWITAPFYKCLQFMACQEKDKAWFTVTDTPWCAIYSTKQAIHSGCFVSARIRTEVTFNSDTFPTAAPKPSAPVPMTPHQITHCILTSSRLTVT